LLFPFASSTMQKTIIFAALLSLALAVPLRLKAPSAEEDLLWDRFKVQYKRSFFDARDETYRKTVFLTNLRKIQKHNDEQSEGWHTFTMAMNEFGDLTTEEFFAKYTGFLGARDEVLRSQNTEDLSHVAVAADVDWVASGAVTPVKNQGQCGSCWAFSSTGAIEGAWKIAKGSLISLSEQQLMDCSKTQGNKSCEGGLMDYAFQYVVRNGITLETSYPYTARDATSCKSFSKAATISRFTDVARTEAALMAAVTQQPVSVAIEADQEAFQFYSTGVLTGTCGTQLDHGVLAVGYGTLNGVQYWKVKNSWGTGWGSSGYVLIQKGKAQSGGQCGILLAASYPTV